MIADSGAPYRRILTHGFVVDGNGRKISKSDGKPQTADSYVKKYGADVLRLWVCSEDFRRDIPLSDEILEQVVRSYRTLRNTLKFQLGNLHDFNIESDKIPFEDLDPIDKWVLCKTSDLIKEVTEHFDAYELHQSVQVINRFCSGVLSSTYHDVIKDRLYTLHPDDPKRRSTQNAINIIFESLVKLIGPLTPFTADEAWSFLHSGEQHSPKPLLLESWPEDNKEWVKSSDVLDVQILLDLKYSSVTDVLEGLRASKEIGQSLDAELEFKLPDNDKHAEALSNESIDLAELFVVSNVVLSKNQNLSAIEITARHAPGVRCPRSWRWVPKLVEIEPWEKFHLVVPMYLPSLAESLTFEILEIMTKKKTSTSTKATRAKKTVTPKSKR